MGAGHTVLCIWRDVNAVGRLPDGSWVAVGIPTFRTSLSPTQANLTPAAVREALRRYSFETRLSIVDAGDAPTPTARMPPPSSPRSTPPSWSPSAATTLPRSR